MVVRTPLLMCSLLWLCLGTLSATAEIYKTVDENGKVIYTDNPKGKKAEAVKLPPVNTQKAIEVRTTPFSTNGKEGTEKSSQYSLSITSPANDTTVTKGQESITVKISLTPALGKGHQLQLLLNGKPHGGKSRSGTFTLSDLYRGSHSLQAQVVNKDNKALASSGTITLHVKRHSIVKGR